MLQLLNQFPRLHSIAIFSLSLIIALVFAWPSPSEPVQIPLQVPDLVVQTDIFPEQQRLKHLTYTVQSGDSLSSLFDKAGVAPQVMFELLADNENKRTLRAIQPGEKITFHLKDDSHLSTLEYVRSPVLIERFDFTEDKITHTSITRTPEYRTRHASGAIQSSLFLAGQRAGMTDNLTMELAQIFGWDIDFALDIRQGDAFSMIYQEKYLDGEFLGYGPILAARFVNNGREYVAVRYTDNSGYSDFYSPDGKSMRKAFLRTPVEFARISSHFSLGRRHPILNKIRNHKGTDYAAPTGTPIRAAGDGKIIFAGSKGGYGNTVVVQHGQRYSTLYAHMKNFHRNTRSGRYVKQGQIIGYVGSTGLATGPHLHYEFRVNGVAVNPVTVKLPSAQPIAEDVEQEFMAHASNMVGQLAIYEGTSLAAIE